MFKSIALGKFMVDWRRSSHVVGKAMTVDKLSPSSVYKEKSSENRLKAGRT